MDAINKDYKPRIRPEVAAMLKHYVYAYVDPRTSQIFYVGKGCRGRVYTHLDDATECEKVKTIRSIISDNLIPEIHILAHGMEKEEDAFRVEAAVIDSLGIGKGKLTNRVRGVNALEFGRQNLAELEFQYAAKPVEIEEKVLLIRINRLFRAGMKALELQEATRGIWKVGRRRFDAKFAFAVYQGVVREVYLIESWHRAGTLQYQTRPDEEVQSNDRWEFSGQVDSRLSGKYRGRSVVRYFPLKSQNPITYVNC